MFNRKRKKKRSPNKGDHDAQTGSKSGIPAFPGPETSAEPVDTSTRSVTQSAQVASQEEQKRDEDTSTRHLESILDKMKIR